MPSSLAKIIEDVEIYATPCVDEAPTPFFQLVRDGEEFNRTLWYFLVRLKANK